MSKRPLNLPDVPNAPLELFTLNQSTYTTLGPDRYYAFTQIFFSKTLSKYLTTLIKTIQERRQILGIKDCNYDALSIRELNRNSDIFLVAIQRSHSVEFAKSFMDGFLEVIKKHYWETIKKYLERGLTPLEYIERMFTETGILLRSHEDELSRSRKGGAKSRTVRLRRRTTLKRK